MKKSKIVLTGAGVVAKIIEEPTWLNRFGHIECEHGWMIMEFILHNYVCGAKFLRASHDYFVKQIPPKFISYEFTRKLTARPIKEGELFYEKF